MAIFQKANANNQILNKLIYDHCLSFGRSPKINNKKITHFISGTRQKIDIFNLYEMRYLLLKVYPLIHNLFLQERLNVNKKKKIIFDMKESFPKVSRKLPKPFWIWQNYNNIILKFKKSLQKGARPLLPKILFATTTELYSTIVSSAAVKCHMPFHVSRWLSGTITAGSSYLDDFEKWSFLTNDLHDGINKSFRKNFFKYKKNITQHANQIRKYQLGRKPSLIIIPDVSNNDMIVKETNTFGIPVLGLINSNSKNAIAYPVFANDLSIYSIHFFCHFLSSLITKEIVKTKHKLYNPSKKTVSVKFSQAIERIFEFRARISKFQHLKKKSWKPGYSFKGYYFLNNLVKPRIRIRKKQSFLESKPKKIDISPKNLIQLENQKRFQKNKTRFFIKKRILRGINLIKKMHHFSFSKIVPMITLPVNKPAFRFWNQNKFYFSNSLTFLKNTILAFQFKRFSFPKFLRKRRKKIKYFNRFNWKKKNQNRHKRKSNKIAQVYRKRWSSKKVKKINLKKN